MSLLLAICDAFFLIFVSARCCRRALRALASPTFLIDEALIARSFSRACSIRSSGRSMAYPAGPRNLRSSSANHSGRLVSWLACRLKPSSTSLRFLSPRSSSCPSTMASACRSIAACAVSAPSIVSTTSSESYCACRPPTCFCSPSSSNLASSGMSTGLPVSRGSLPPLGRFAPAALSPAGPPHARPPVASASAALSFSALPPFLALFAAGASDAPASPAAASSSASPSSASSPSFFFLPLVACSVKRFRRACARPFSAISRMSSSSSSSSISSKRSPANHCDVRPCLASRASALPFLEARSRSSGLRISPPSSLSSSLSRSRTSAVSCSRRSSRAASLRAIVSGSSAASSSSAALTASRFFALERPPASCSSTLSVAETRRCVRVLYSSYMVSSCWSSLST
mmetsp:Transcript_48098/g.115610  ORF Transcript_48098/g.115610 Transcript_48098/m.115610 type:complete len:402 (-) Transcript_48098:426-1631(-)